MTSLRPSKIFPKSFHILWIFILLMANISTPESVVGQATTALSDLTCIDLQPVLTDFGSGARHQTGEKPQSKVWRHAGNWWGIFPTTSDGASSAGTWAWQLVQDTWSPVLKLSNDEAIRADIKMIGNVVHAVLHDDSPELVSIEYISGSYQLWSQRATLVSLPASDPSDNMSTIDIDSTGRMWYVYDTTSAIVAHYSDAPYSTWNGPVTIVDDIDEDDIGAVIAMPNNAIGVFWSDQSEDQFGFRLHTDGDDPTIWSTTEVVESGSSDDHLNLAVASDGTLYVAVKTSTDLIKLLIRDTSGTWQAHEVDDVGTRPIVLLNEIEGVVTVIYTEANGLEPIVYKESAMSSIDFDNARETLSDGGFNDASSSKNRYSNELVVVFTDDDDIYGVFCEPATSALDVRSRMSESLGSFTYSPQDTSNGATLGTLLINFDFLYNNGNALENIYFEVTTANNAFLQNAEGGAGGLGADLFIVNADLPDTISPSLDLFDVSETMTVPFEVGISDAPWGLNFAMYGFEAAGVQAANRVPLASYTIDSSMFDLESAPQMAPSIFLPLIGQ